VISSRSFISLNYSTPMMVVVASLLTVVIGATMFGNVLVGLALFRFRSLRTVSNFLIGNLALSDLTRHSETPPGTERLNPALRDYTWH